MSAAEPRLSARVRRIAPSPMLKLAAKAASLKAAGRDIISLATGEPDFDTPEHIRRAACAAIEGGDTHYTAVDGTAPLKAAIVRKFRRDNGLEFRPDQISVGAGAKQVIFNALAATIDDGDEVIVATPTFPSYIEIVRMFGGTPVIVETGAETGFRLEPAALKQAITPRTKWIILNAPGNPSGAVYSRGQLKALAEVLLANEHVWILADDIYEHLVYAEVGFETIAAVEPRLAGRTLTVNGVSKAYCMTGWRIGYAGGPTALVTAMATVQSQVTSCSSSVSQAAAAAALDGPQEVLHPLRDAFRARRDAVVEELAKIKGVDCQVPDGAFYAFPSCKRLIGLTMPGGGPISDDRDFASYLLDAVGVIVVPGSDFGTPGHFRISYAAETAELVEAVRRIGVAVSALS